MKDMEAAMIARLLVNEVICRFGVPDSMDTDQGRNFESTLILAAGDKENVHHPLSSTI